MNLHLTKVISSFILLATSITSFATPDQATVVYGKISFAQNLVIDVEIAANSAQRERGLMYRSQLASNQGMLFVYPDEAERAVWMRNTLLPLDVLFLSADSKIVTMIKNLQPCQHDPCQIYPSKASAMYMLELNAGFIDNNHLEIGQELILEYRHSEQ